MGRAMLHVMKTLESRGFDPIEALPKKPDGHGEAWRRFPGKFSSVAVAEALSKSAPNDPAIRTRWLHVGKMQNPLWQIILISQVCNRLGIGHLGVRLMVRIHL